MRVLITGATGFVGSHLCRRMAIEGHPIRIFVRPSSDPTRFKELPVETVIGDITDLESVQLAVQGQDWVIHAAANLSYWGKDQTRQMKVNVDGTRHVAYACRSEGITRLVHVSSVAAVGIPTDPRYPANEDFPFNIRAPSLNYHLSKWRAEEEVMQEVVRGLDAVIVNPASIFGPNGEQYRGADMIRKVRRPGIVPYFTGGLCAVHIDDVVDGILAALKRGMIGHRYILGGENLTFRQLAKRSLEAMDLNRWLVPVPPAVTGLSALILEPWGRLRNRRPRITYAVHYCASRYHFYDSSKARKALNYAPHNFNAILDECLRLGRKSHS